MEHSESRSNELNQADHADETAFNVEVTFELSEETELDLPVEPYRGIKPFRYVDQRIFSVRDWEKKQLFNLIILYRGSLLYGETGIGKSSVINAGLVPLLEKNKLNAEVIRIYPSKEETFCVYKIGKSDDCKSYFPSLFDVFTKNPETTPAHNQPTITISFNDFKQHLLLQTYENVKDANTPTPVLIFDQFEEIVTLFEETGKASVSPTDVALHDRKNFQSELIKFFRECYYTSNLRVKFLFSFREDYLAKLSPLLRAIPDLRDHSLRIKAIAKRDIEEIIRCPFSYDVDSAKAYPKAFSETEINLLNKKLIEYFRDQDTVLTDVQIACQYLYEMVREKRKELFINNGIEVENSIEKIIQLFYAKQLENLPQKDKALATDILALLVLNEHTRNIFHFDAIIDELKKQYTSGAITQVLLSLDSETKLIRSEIRPGGTYYEINSESLIPYINGLKILKEKEESKNVLRKKIGYYSLPIAVILILTLIYFYYTINEQKKINLQSQYLFAAGANKYTNPTLSYIISKKSYSIGGSNSKLNNLISTFSLSKNAYISNIFSYPGNIISVFFKAGSIGVVGENSVEYFDHNGLIKSENIINNIIYADPKLGYLITKKGSNPTVDIDTCELRTFNGTIITTFVTREFPRIFSIAPNRQSFVVDHFIYKIGKLMPDSVLQIPPVAKDLMIATFAWDSKHILAGFWSGHVIVYALNGKMVKAFTTGSFNSVATCLAVCKNMHYLVVGGRDNNLRFFEIGNINLPGKDSLRGNEIISDPKTIYQDNEDIPGQINNIIMAPDDKTFLSVSDDKIGFIWDFDGKKINVLNGHKESIVSGAFSPDGRQILTWSSTGKIFVWQNGNIEKAYNKHMLVTFSPYDYRSSGLENYSVNDVYSNNQSPEGSLTEALNYIASLPEYNYHSEDKDYKKTIDISLKELSALFTKLLQPSKITKLSFLNGKLLYESYGKFRGDSLNLVDGKPHDQIATYTRFVDDMLWQSKALVIDMNDLKTATTLTESYIKAADLFADSAMKKNYKMSVLCLKNAIDLESAYKIRYSTVASIDNELAALYGNLSWYSLFTKDYVAAIEYAKKGISLGKKNDWIYTNLALGYLLTGKFNEAEKIYKDYKDKPKGNGRGYFRVAFLSDLQILTKEKIINANDKKLTTEVALVRTIIGEKSK